MTSRQNLDYESIFESISDEFQVSNEVFRQHLNDLVDIGLIERNINELEDKVWYTGKDGLHFAEFSAIDDQVKQQILQQFISCPTMFFGLQNTQAGKSDITIKKIISWEQDQIKRFVTIVMLTSDIGLGGQTVGGIEKKMKLEGVIVKTIQLVSTCKIDMDAIKDCIDSYASNPEKPMPLIVALSNDKQMAKVLEILNHISNRHQKHPNLAYGMIWDEADKTYTTMRNKVMNVDGKDLCIRNFMIDNVNALGGCGWITATEGNLLQLDQYPECANSYAMHIEMDPEDIIHYRAFHHPEAIIKKIKMGRKNNNGIFLDDIFLINKPYFMDPIRTQDGQLGYRKTIVNASVKTSEHAVLAKKLNEERCHAMTFNQSGLNVYALDASKQTFKIKGVDFKSLLFYVYKKCNLHTAPLVILGRIKVDRGLSFHYAPRSHRIIETSTIDFGLGPLITDGIEGLIWTDMFLGHVEIKESATQKAGRLAGYIGQCPQYLGNVTWWTDEETAVEVRHQNEKVDRVNHQVECKTMGQAMAKTEQEMNDEEAVAAPAVEAIKEPKINKFATQEQAKEYYNTNLKARLGGRGRGPNKRNPDENGFYLSTIGKGVDRTRIRSTLEIHEVRRWALNETHDYTFHPCYEDVTNKDTLQWWLIHHE